MKQQNSSHRAFFYLVGFSAIFLAFIYTSIFSYQQYSDLRHKLTDTTANNDRQLRAALSMRTVVRERAILLWKMSLKDTPKERKALFDRFYKHGSAYHKARLTVMNTQLDQTERGIINQLDFEENKRAPDLQAFAKVLTDQTDRDFRAELSTVLKDKTVIAALLDQFINLQQFQNDDAWQESAQSLETLLSELITRMVLIILGGFIFAAYVIITSSKQGKLLLQANEELKHIACHDNLTGLPNRRFLLHQLEVVLAAAKRRETKAAVIFIDLDDFKPINDNFGHEMGDMCLKELSDNISEVIRGSDMLGRLGGDEFLLILADVPSSTQVIAIVEKLLSTINQEIELGPTNVQVTASIGVYIYALEDVTAEEAITLADKAMYQAKKQGKNKYYII